LVHLYRVDNTWQLAMSGRFAEIVPASQRILEEPRGMSLEELEGRHLGLAEQYRTFLNATNMEAVSFYPHLQFGTLNARYRRHRAARRQPRHLPPRQHHCYVESIL